MYIPAPFLVEDRKVIGALMRQFEFAAVVSYSDAAGLVASHLPVLIREVGSELPEPLRALNARPLQRRWNSRSS